MRIFENHHKGNIQKPTKWRILDKVICTRPQCRSNKLKQCCLYWMNVGPNDKIHTNAVDLPQVRNHTTMRFARLLILSRHAKPTKNYFREFRAGRQIDKITNSSQRACVCAVGVGKSAKHVFTISRCCCYRPNFLHSAEYSPFVRI